MKNIINIRYLSLMILCILVPTIVRSMETEPYSLNQNIKALKQSPTFQQLTLREFTTLLAGLSIQFPNITREEIALLFNAPIADTYLQINHSFVRAVLIEDSTLRLQHVQDMLKRAGDVNFNFRTADRYTSILGIAYSMAIEYQGKGVVVVELLLKNGANPNVRQLQTTLPKYARKIVKNRCPEYQLLELLQQYGAKIN